ncbi:hypothetical protein CDAR_367171 [Caerostris darwini]|uniref:Uncharacterized protein n=1 Tax=Caerostris darwini TaxID=1538125 RepID=A0AAV4WLQ1_9ARAC|nr:hypothetical protein CDAR_367171 [Caerostris darwini]
MSSTSLWECPLYLCGNVYHYAGISLSVIYGWGAIQAVKAPEELPNLYEVCIILLVEHYIQCKYIIQCTQTKNVDHDLLLLTLQKTAFPFPSTMDHFLDVQEGDHRRSLQRSEFLSVEEHAEAA